MEFNSFMIQSVNSIFGVSSSANKMDYDYNIISCITLYMCIMRVAFAFDAVVVVVVLWRKFHIAPITMAMHLGVLLIRHCFQWDVRQNLIKTVLFWNQSYILDHTVDATPIFYDISFFHSPMLVEMHKDGAWTGQLSVC